MPSPSPEITLALPVRDVEHARNLVHRIRVPGYRVIIRPQHSSAQTLGEYVLTVIRENPKRPGEHYATASHHSTLPHDGYTSGLMLLDAIHDSLWAIASDNIEHLLTYDHWHPYRSDSADRLIELRRALGSRDTYRSTPRPDLTRGPSDPRQAQGVRSTPTRPAAPEVVSDHALLETPADEVTAVDEAARTGVNPT